MAQKEGWKGRYYEDFEVVDVYRCPFGRTVIEADNVWFTLLTMNTNQIHFNTEYAKRTEFGKRLVDSTFTFALVTGMSVSDLTMNSVANLGWDEIRLPSPERRISCSSMAATISAPPTAMYSTASAASTLRTIKRTPALSC